MADRRRQSAFAAVLADRRFCRIWLAGTLIGVLRWLELLAIGVFTLELTGSAFLVSLLTMLRMLPLFLFGIPMGALAERFDRKTLMLLGLVVLALSSATLAALACLDRLALWHVGLSAFVNGCFWAGEFPVRRTMLGEIAGPERLGPAMALESSTSNATRMLGPALGGLLLESLGLAGVFVTGALAYLACIVLVRPVVYRTEVGHRAIGVVHTIREGWLACRRSRMITASLAITMIVNLWGFAYITMVPVIGERQLGLDALLIGLLASTEGLGALIGSIIVGIAGTPARYTRIYLYASFAFLAAVLGIGLSAWIPLSFALMFAAGISISGFSVMQSTITFLVAPPDMRSRVMGVLTVSIGTGPIGMLHVGLLAEWLGAGTAVTVMAIEGLIALSLVAVCWPELRRATVLSP